MEQIRTPSAAAPASTEPRTGDGAVVATGTGGDRPDGRGGYGELQQVFTTVLLAIVGAYGMTNSVWLTMAAAVLALVVTVVVSRKK